MDQTPAEKTLQNLREQAALPNHGQPARYRVQFIRAQLVHHHGLPTASQWWWDEASVQIRNLTSTRGKFGSFEVWFDDLKDAEIVAMLLRPYILGIMDHQQINWLFLAERPTHCPDLL